MNWDELLDGARPFLSRVLAALIAACCMWLMRRWNFKIDQETQGALSDAVMLIIYAVLHKLIDKPVNPADSASKHLAQAGIVRADALKGGGSAGPAAN